MIINNGLMKWSPKASKDFTLQYKDVYVTLLAKWSIFILYSQS